MWDTLTFSADEDGSKQLMIEAIFSWATFSVVEHLRSVGRQKIHYSFIPIEEHNHLAIHPPSNTQTPSPLFSLTMVDIMNVVDGIVNIEYHEHCNKESLIEAVIQQAPAHILTILTTMALNNLLCPPKRSISTTMSVAPR